MSVVINTNFAATVAANNLAGSNEMLQKSLNRLSSGSKIVTPADDAGGLAVSMKLSAAARRQGAVATNIGNAVSFLQTQDGVLKVAAKVLDRMQQFLPQLTVANVVVDWYNAAGNLDNTCTPATCGAVNIRIRDLNYQWITPVGFSLPNAIAMPSFSTYLPREAMGTDPNSASVCSVS